MVEGPISPGVDPKETIVSIAAIIISGAEEPSAIKLRLATLAFHTSTVIFRAVPFGSFLVTSFSKLVMTWTKLLL